MSNEVREIIGATVSTPIDPNKFPGGGSSITVDDAMSETSTNPVQNRVVKAELDKKVSQNEHAALSAIDVLGYAVLNGVVVGASGNTIHTKSGAPLDFWGTVLSNIGSPENEKDAVNKEYVDDLVGNIEAELAEQSEEIGGIKDTLENLPSGSGTVRTELVIDTPVWDNQPTASAADLKAIFQDWTTKNYFVTLKDASGTALPSGQFKLTETIDGYAKAVDCVFTLEGHTLTENYPVDFKEVDGVFKLRDAGIVRVNINFKNPLSQKYQILYNGGIITNLTSGVRFVYLADDYMQAKGGKVIILCPVGKYTGSNGILNSLSSVVNGGSKLVGFKISSERTKNGSVGQWNALADATNSNQSSSWFTNTTSATEDYTKEDVNAITLITNNQIWFANGSVVVLEETA
jgi:hypothetical protein